MTSQTVMTYGGTEISPVPIVKINRESNKARNKFDPISFIYKLTLTGFVTNLGTEDPISFPATVDKAQVLRELFSVDGKFFEVKCVNEEEASEEVVFHCWPRIINIDLQESNDNWVQTIPYTIELEYDVDNSIDNITTQAFPLVDSVSEEWSFEFNQDEKYFNWDLSTVVDQKAGYDYATNDSNNPFEANVSRTLTAVGKTTYEGAISGDGTGVEGAINALNYLTGVYLISDYNPIKWGHSTSGSLNLDSGEYSTYNHYRTQTINDTEGSVTLNDTWLVIGNNSGLNGITEEFTLNINKTREDRNWKVSAEGQIQGHETRLYSTTGALTPVTGQAYDAASSGWLVIQNRIFPRAQLVFEQENTPTTLNPDPLNKTVGHLPSKGTITYSYEYDDRLCSFISGSISEQFTISDKNPNDVFTTLTVLGRQKGPILQDVDTFTESTRSINIEVIMPPPTACDTIDDLDLWKPTSGVEALICQFQTQLTDSYDQVFVNADSVNWVPLDGRYTRSIGWTYGGCSGSGNTNFC